jgi:hypothetical protein
MPALSALAFPRTCFLRDAEWYSFGFLLLIQLRVGLDTAVAFGVRRITLSDPPMGSPRNATIWRTPAAQ